MDVLVIGGTQFIGRHTVREVLRRGHDVTLFHRGQSPSPFGDRVRERLGDRMHPEDVKRATEGESWDAVIDLAYIWGPGTGPAQVSSVLDAVGDLERYVFLSTCGVYHFQRNGRATEENPRGPTMGQYSVDKIATEDLLLAAQEEG
ncbi:MAG: NAD-dependent epimerase/dehydratase family protein, partial [Thermoplasmata archaeon]|nr:NAD-dependent epimerase/dehydratase family protein [Thermoplasmata archaeon]